MIRFKKKKKRNLGKCRYSQLYFEFLFSKHHHLHSRHSEKLSCRRHERSSKRCDGTRQEGPCLGSRWKKSARSRTCQSTPPSRRTQCENLMGGGLNIATGSITRYVVVCVFHLERHVWWSILLSDSIYWKAKGYSLCVQLGNTREAHFLEHVLLQDHSHQKKARLNRMEPEMFLRVWCPQARGMWYQQHNFKTCWIPSSIHVESYPPFQKPPLGWWIWHQHP